jgi:uncharacterized protein YndB with AHSA1/START domain
MVARVERSVVLDSDVERVWDAVVDDASSWFGGDVDIDARPGGAVTVRDEDGERRGTVEVCEPQRSLAFRVWTSPLDGPMEGSRVEIHLEPLDDSHTALTVVETKLSARASALAHA